MKNKIRLLLNKLKVIRDKVITWFITKHYTRKGKKIAKKYVIGKTYYNAIKNCYAIYRGNKRFYESRQVLEPTYGITFYDSRTVEYTDLQIGLFKDLWVPAEVQIVTDCGPELMNNPYKFD